MPLVDRLDTRARGVVAGHSPVARVLPGEEIEVCDGKTRILQPSEHRVKPPCRHAKACGGCALQHASDGFVAQWKTDVIARGLAAQGIEAPIRPIHTSPPGTRRRAVLHGRRTKSGAMLGFHAAESPILTDTPDCQLLDPQITSARPGLLALTSALCSRKGEIDLALTVSRTGLDVDVRSSQLAPGVERTAPALAETHGFARISLNGETLAQRDPPFVRFGPAQVAPPPGAFLQATEDGQTALQAAVAEALGPAKRVVDLFAGCGTFTLSTLQSAPTHAVEGEATLLQALDAAWRHATDLRALTTERRDLFRRPLMRDELEKIDGVIIDPPRAGAEAQSIELAKSKVSRIAAVSCNPVTFARDARILTAGGYRLAWVQPVDQFRWSAHVELAALFERV